MGAGEHTSKQYEAELENTCTRVLQMGGLVESQIRSAIEGFGSGDAQLLARVVADDHRVNSYEVSIDEACANLIARRQPAAIDLRLILAICKIVTDLERSGDEAEKIARMSLLVHERGMHSAQRFPNIRHAATSALSMLRMSLDAFARRDADTAAEVLMQDLAIDNEFRSVLRQLITFVMEDPRIISTALEIVWIAKAIERIGDHAKNMAEQVIYIVKGTDVRHTAAKDIPGIER
jgi:phosphate transport system protein